MAITDQFGRTYASHEDFRPTPIAEHRRLTETVSGRYLGLLTRWHSVGWTHSLSRFGEPALSDLGTALHEFMHRAGIAEHVSVGSREPQNTELPG